MGLPTCECSYGLVFAQRSKEISAALFRSVAFGEANAKPSQPADALGGATVRTRPAQFSKLSGWSRPRASVKLRSVERPELEAFFGVVGYLVLADSIVANAPAWLAPTAWDIEAVLRAAF